MRNHYNLQLLIVGFICLFSISIHGQKVYELMEKDGVRLKEVQEEAKTYFETVGTGKGTGYKLFKRWEHHAYKRLQEDGTLLSKKVKAKSIHEFKEKNKAKGVSSKSVASVSDWSEMGPLMIGIGASGSTPGIGRITTIYVEPNNQQLIYVGSPGGGLWKSINAGSSWTPLGDEFEDMSIWSVTCDPNNLDIVYYGNSSGQLFKSTNGGLSFTKLFDENGAVQSILINPNNSNELYATVKFKGLFRSQDGGNSWTLVISDWMEDVMFKPGSTSTIYACGINFYKSSNSGNSFTKITNGISNSGRMRLAVTPANNNYVYVVQAKGSSFGWLYRSIDSGDNFTAQTSLATTGDIVGVQASRNMVISVSDTDAEEVHTGGLNLYKSVNGGTNFIQETSWLKSFSLYPYLHGDQEDAFFVNGNMYVGTDGGIVKSSDSGASFTDLSVGLGIQQFYSIASAASNKGVIAGAAQDNGPVIKYGTANAWRHWSSGDGVSCAIDPTDANIVYSCTQYGGLKKTINGGNSKDRDLLTAPEDNNGLWVTPIVVDTNDNKRVYVGYKDLYRHDNSAIKGSAWVKVSSGEFSFKLSHINLCPSDENTVYVVAYRSLFKSTNVLSATPTWTEYPQSAFINDVAVDPYDENRVVVVASNGTVRLTTDGASTWTDISAGLPSNIAVEAVVLDRSPDKGIYVAIDGIVFYRSNSVPTWTVFSNNLPNVDITKLDLYYGATNESRIRVATYGRGAWESPLYDDADSRGANTLATDNLELISDDDKVLIYPNPVSSTMHVQLPTEGEDILMTIIGLGGNIVSENNFKTHNGLNLLKVDTEQLTSSPYVLQILKGKTKITKKFVVE